MIEGFDTRMNYRRVCPQAIGVLLAGLASLSSLGCSGGVAAPPETQTALHVFVDFTEVEENEEQAYLGNPMTKDPDELATVNARLDDFLEKVEFIDKPQPGFGRELSPAAGTVTFHPLYDFVLTDGRETVAELSAPEPDETSFLRRRTERVFREKVHTAYQELFENNPTQGAEYPQTQIVAPVCRFLDGLPATAAPTQQWRVVLLSDMVENSDVFSFHTDPGKTDQEIIDIFQMECAGVSVSSAVVNNMTISMCAQTPATSLPREKRARMEELILRAEPIWEQFFQAMGLEVASC